MLETKQLRPCYRMRNNQLITNVRESRDILIHLQITHHKDCKLPSKEPTMLNKTHPHYLYSSYSRVLSFNIVICKYPPHSSRTSHGGGCPPAYSQASHSIVHIGSLLPRFPTEFCPFLPPSSQASQRFAHSNHPLLGLPTEFYQYQPPSTWLSTELCSYPTLLLGFSRSSNNINSLLGVPTKF